MNTDLSEEEQMAINCSYEACRKAMIRAGQEKRRNLAAAGKSIYILERFHMDKVVHRRITTVIAVSEKKESLIDFFHEHYFSDVEFDEQGRTKDVDTDMGEGSFSIFEVAFVG